MLPWAQGLETMPSKSKKQRRFMSAAAHSKEFASKAGIPQSVAKEFHEADKGKSYGARKSPALSRKKK
jgi:hypothetical protein